MSRRSTGSSVLNDLRGKRFPAFVVSPQEKDGGFSVGYPQFYFGIGNGDTHDEALEDAKFILAYGLHCATDGPVPEPATIDEAKKLAEGILLADLDLTANDVEWITVEVDPDVLTEEDMS